MLNVLCCCLLRHFFPLLSFALFMELQRLALNCLFATTSFLSFFYRTTEETRKRSDNGPFKLEVQVQPSASKAQTLTGEQISMPVTTYDPTFETRNPFNDPSLAASIYQQQQINLRPSSYGPNIFDPNIYNAALLNQQFLPPIDSIGFRQSDSNVSCFHAT
jgi:hypothetical protein